MPTAAAAAAVQIAGPASENIDVAWMTTLFECGALQHLNQITVHPYRSDSPETALADFAVVRRLVDEYAPVGGATVAINSGEWGHATTHATHAHAQTRARHTPHHTPHTTHHTPVNGER